MSVLTRACALSAVAAALLGAIHAGTASTADNGTFRFLTSAFPDGSTDSEYVTRLLAANADGPVLFGATGLPAGLALDVQSGFLAGRPLSTFNGDIDITASDGTNMLMTTIPLKISATGGGGNAGATFDVASLPDGQVGTPYATTLTVSNASGTLTYGAVDLPPGLSLDGATGDITGTPAAAGTSFVSLSVYDDGDGNKVVKVVPIVVLPKGSDFRFTTRFLNNGEVGTIYYDLYQTTGGAAGTPTFGASGLPAGLTLNSNTGEAGGVPTQSGTFPVRITAVNGGDTITANLTVSVVPGSASSTYWGFFGIPVGLEGVAYTRQPPIHVSVVNPDDTATYSVSGLPAGMSYDSLTGEITGTPPAVGEFPLTFTASIATDPPTLLTLITDLVVLPPEGGDLSDLSVNLWVAKESLKAGVPGDSSWKGSAIWNADRRTGSAFDPATDSVVLQVGSHVVTVAPGLLQGTPNRYSFASAAGVVPSVKLQVSTVKQTLKWSVRNDTIGEFVPSTLRHVTFLGGLSYRLDQALDAKGVFHPALDYRRKSFVCSKASLSAGDPGGDSLNLSLLLGDPAFTYLPGVSVLRFRLLEGTNVLMDRDFTALGTATPGTDRRTGADTYSLKALSDPATADRVARFAFKSAKGKMSLALTDLTLVGVPATEAHLGLELTVGTNLYLTSVTFFETTPGRYTTAMPF